MLWVDAHQVPGHSSWMTKFALNIVQAAMTTGCGSALQLLWSVCRHRVDREPS